MTTGHPKPFRIGGAPKPAPSSWLALVNLAVAQETAMVLARFGLVPDPPMPEPGADPDALGPGSSMLVDIGRIMATSARRSGCGHFGLLVGQGDVLAALALAGCLLPGVGTVGDALENLVGHLKAHAGAAAPMLVVEGLVASLSYVTMEPSDERADQVADLTAALAVNVIRTLCSADWCAAEVTLPRSAPTDPTPFTRYYRSPIRFGAGAAAVTFPVAILDRPVEAVDLLRVVFTAHQAPRTPHLGGGFGEDVRRVLRARITVQDCSAKTIAASFSMHSRTLNRHLRAEGLSFNVMVNEVRFEISRQLIAEASMSLGQIAAVLCFSEPSAFTRAFRRWSGQSPTAWRADHPAP